MMDDTREEAQQIARRTAKTAKETAEEAAGATSRASEGAAGNYEEIWSLSRDSMQRMAGAGQAMVHGASDLGNIWASFWSEQLTSSVDTMRSLAKCHTWNEALAVQNEFARTSLDRVCSRTVRSAEATTQLLASSLVPMREATRQAAERASR
jgi:hypothetical protein